MFLLRTLIKTFHWVICYGKVSYCFNFHQIFPEELNWVGEKIKGALYGLRQFLATEGPLKMMKNVFHFTLKALFVLKIFKFLSWLFGHV